MYLFPDNDVRYSPNKSSPTLDIGNGCISESWSGE